MKIEIGFDELPSNGEKCSECLELIEGMLIRPYCSVGDPSEVVYLNLTYCLPCFENLGEKSSG